MRHTPAAGRSARRGGGCASLSYPQRRANGRGHAALLAQSLDSRCAVTHMPTPEWLRRAPLAVSPDTLIPNSRATGGRMVAVTAWPNGRGERHNASCERRSGRLPSCSEFDRPGWDWVCLSQNVGLRGARSYTRGRRDESEDFACISLLGGPSAHFDDD